MSLAGMALRVLAIGATGVGVSCARGPFDVHVTVVGGELGRVSADALPFTCDSDCVLSVAADTPLVLHPSTVGVGVFQGWSGACNGTGDCQLKVTRDAEVTAVFAPRKYSLHVQLTGEGGGAVRLPDGSQCQDACDVPITAGQGVHLEALPREDSYLVNWEGACSGEGTGCDFEAADASATAHFGRKYRLEVTGITSSTMGRVLSDPPGINCGQTCSMWVRPGLKVGLTAQATDEMWRFRGWSDTTCTGPYCEFVATADTSIDARFSSVHSWSRTFGFGPVSVTSKANGELTLALSAANAQDFGAGLVTPKVYSVNNLFVTRYSRDGQPLFTSVLGGDVDISLPGVQELSGGNISVAVQVASVLSQDESVDFGGYSATIPSGGRVPVWFNMSGNGVITAAGPLDPGLEVASLLPSATAAYGWVDHNLQSVGRILPDWTTEWVFSEPNKYGHFEFAASRSDDVLWVTTPDVPVEMNCQGGPLTTGALLKIEADGTCKVAWQYPDSFVADLVRAPDGAPILIGDYVTGFNFAGTQLPDAMFSGRPQSVRLRFDADANPRWAHVIFVGGGESEQTVTDVAMLKDGPLLMTGLVNGISEVSPTDPSIYELYLAICDDTAGDLTWVHTIPKYSKGSVSPAIGRGGRFVPLTDGRIALYGDFIGGGLDFGGGPRYVLASGSQYYLAVYDF